MIVRRSGVILAAVAMASALTAVSVLAHPMDRSGGAGSTDDWPDEHLLCKPEDCNTEISSGNVVGVWQVILWAEDLLADCGGTGVDGIFGSTTKTQTIAWQQAFGIGADGKVGQTTWGTADNRTFEPDGKTVIYDAMRTTKSVEFYLPAPGTVYQVGWKGAFVNTDHFDRSIDRC
ncbi:MAG: peptidoglycan-binding domain-containing protein [Acidimicrobiia bacterium]